MGKPWGNPWTICLRVTQPPCGSVKTISGLTVGLKMAVLDNAIWLTGAGGSAANGTTTLSDGGASTTVTGTFTPGAWDTTQNGYNVSEFGAFGITAPITADYQFSQSVENLSFDLQHVNSSGSTYDDMFTIYAYDNNGDLIPSADVIAGLSGLVDETIVVNPDGSVSVEADGGVANDVTVNLPGYISHLKVVYEDGPDGTQSGGAGIGDLSFTIPLPDDIVEGTGSADYIDAGYNGDPEGDRIDNGDSTGAQTGNAGSDDDYVRAGAGNDTVIAGQGDDEVYGQGGRDSLEGEGGDDDLYGNGGADTLRGGAGDDFLSGGGGADSLYGNEDNDTIIGGSGNDTIDGDVGDDSIDGGADDDSINGDVGDDTIKGGAGDDWLRGSIGNDEMWGGTGDDFIWGGFNDDTINIENDFGNDTITAEDIDEVNGDVLDLSRVTDDLDIDLTGSNPEVGTFSDGVSTAYFEEIENIILSGGRDTIHLADFSGSDFVKAFDMVDSGDGTTNDQLNVTKLTSDWGTTPVNATDVVVTDDGSGNAVLTFPGGENITLVGVSPSQLDGMAKLVSIGIPPAPSDYIVEGSAGDDTIDAGYMDDPDGDRIDNNDHSDGSNDDSVVAGAGDDSVLSGAGDDTIYGGDGADTIRGGAGDDSLDGDDGSVAGGADEIDGDDGNDTIFGDASDDTLDGGAGNDEIHGGTDNDLISGGNGDDLIHGDGGDDTITLEDGFGNDTIYSGETDETDGDTLDLSALTVDTTIDLTSYNSEKFIISDGTDTTVAEEIETIILGGGRDTLILGDGSGADTVNAFDMSATVDGSTKDQLDVSSLTTDGATPVTASDVLVSDTNGDGSGDAILTFPDGESITLVGVTVDQVDSIAELNAIGIPCFTPGTLITTAMGQVMVEDITAGDLVQTVDHGLQPVKWVRHQAVTASDLAKDPCLRPIVIRKFAFGNQRKMLVSPQHGLVWGAADGQLIRAKHAAEHLGSDIARIDRNCMAVTYIHMMFDQHQLVYAEGAPTEAFYPGPMALKSLDADTMSDLMSVFPSMARLIFEGAEVEAIYGPPARHYLKVRDIRMLLQRAA